MTEPRPTGVSTDADLRRVAERLVGRFQHMASRDGGALTVLDAGGTTIHLAYRPGVDPTCDSGVCILPGAELRDLIGETLRRSHPDVELVVDVTTGAAR